MKKTLIVTFSIMASSLTSYGCTVERLEYLLEEVIIPAVDDYISKHIYINRCSMDVKFVDIGTSYCANIILERGFSLDYNHKDSTVLATEEIKELKELIFIKSSSIANNIDIKIYNS